jgi:glycosyltransferase involved in cell wall biosynthesis
VPPGDPKALAAAVLRLLADPGLARALVSEGRHRAAERFDEQAGIDQFLAAAGAALSRTGRRR